MLQYYTVAVIVRERDEKHQYYYLISIGNYIVIFIRHASHTRNIYGRIIQFNTSHSYFLIDSNSDSVKIIKIYLNH